MSRVYIFNLIMMLSEETECIFGNDLYSKKFRQFICDGIGMSIKEYDDLIKEYWG